MLYGPVVDILICAIVCPKLCTQMNICNIFLNVYVIFFPQRQRQQVDENFRPLGTADSSQLGTLKRLQLANIIFNS